MCRVSPYKIPTARGSPLPSPHPSRAEHMASVRAGGDGFRGAGQGGSLCPSQHAPQRRHPPPHVQPTSCRGSHPTAHMPCPAPLLQPPWPPSAVPGGAGVPCPHRSTGGSPLKGRFCFALAAALQCPLDPGFPLRGAGNGSELRCGSHPAGGARRFQRYPLSPRTRSSTKQLRARGHRGHHPCKRGGRYRGGGTRWWLQCGHTWPRGSAHITARPRAEQNLRTATGQSAPMGARTRSRQPGPAEFL